MKFLTVQTQVTIIVIISTLVYIGTDYGRRYEGFVNENPMSENIKYYQNLIIFIIYFGKFGGILDYILRQKFIFYKHYKSKINLKMNKFTHIVMIIEGVKEKAT